MCALHCWRVSIAVAALALLIAGRCEAFPASPLLPPLPSVCAPLLDIPLWVLYAGAVTSLVVAIVMLSHSRRMPFRATDRGHSPFHERDG